MGGQGAKTPYYRPNVPGVRGDAGGPAPTYYSDEVGYESEVAPMTNPTPVAGPGSRYYARYSPSGTQAINRTGQFGGTGSFNYGGNIGGQVGTSAIS